ncbi:MAG TPA: LptA/OstA family protein [Candidatus Sulfotelmatobacter sp.]|nr:LptA/OstA family protein [Candidatus Sulfotelmatobacter sp.]
MNWLKSLIFTISGLAIAGLFYWALFVPKEEATQRLYQTIKEQEKQADLLFKKVSFEEVSAGVKYWQLVAAVGTVNKSTGLATLQKADGTFYKKGQEALLFRSPAALWDMKKKEIFLDQPIGYDVTLRGRIAALLRATPRSPFSIFNLPSLAKGRAGYWFQAKNLSWKLTDERIICTGGILLNKGEVTGYADKLQGDVGLENIRLEGRPYLIVTDPHSAPVTLEAAAFEISGNEGLFVAQGRPKITWKEAVVTSTGALYRQNEKKLELTDNVRINYRDITAAGDSAEYFVAEQKVVLAGHAWAEQAGNQLNGNKVLVSLKDNKISVIGRSRVVIPAAKVTR